MDRSGVVFIIFTSLWIAAIAFGMLVLMNYDYTPGIASTSASEWPASSQICLSKDCPTLIMFVHPQCPCTRASITELVQLASSSKTKFKTYVLLFEPSSPPAGWDKTALWHNAQAIPGATVLADTDGLEAKRFRSITSGQTMIYSPEGKLLFNGGITSARGQEGENVSLNSAKLALHIPSATAKRSPVFGCSIISLNKK